jgi:hypothetical protein
VLPIQANYARALFVRAPMLAGTLWEGQHGPALLSLFRSGGATLSAIYACKRLGIESVQVATRVPVRLFNVVG